MKRHCEKVESGPDSKRICINSADTSGMHFDIVGLSGASLSYKLQLFVYLYNLPPFVL